jgi:hypothetical protein
MTLIIRVGVRTNDRAAGEFPPVFLLDRIYLPLLLLVDGFPLGYFQTAFRPPSFVPGCPDTVHWQVGVPHIPELLERLILLPVKQFPPRLLLFVLQDQLINID